MSLTHGVGVVSSIKYGGTPLQSNFDRGLDQSGWYRVILDMKGYDASDLDDAVVKLSNNNQVGLIVTVGGVVTAVAALRSATKPFISLIGGTTDDFPGTINDRFYGGIILESFDLNSTRVSDLKQDHGFEPGQISLLSNPRSAMYGKETGNWSSATPARGKIYTASSVQEIQSAFTDFGQNQPSLLAMIVSADPFFQDNKDELVSAANQSGKFVCYPLQVYSEAAATLLKGKHRRHGPKLATAYYDLGKKAYTVIHRGRPSSLDRAKNEKKDD